MSFKTNLPWIYHGPDDLSTCRPGGQVILCKAAATLLTGDVVFFSAADTVNKSTTSANYVAFAGVVVGGTRIPPLGEIIDDRLNQANTTGIQAAQANEFVYVQISGIARVVCAAAVAFGAALQVVTTSGQVDDPAAVAGQIVGTALDVGAGAASVIRMLIDHR